MPGVSAEAESGAGDTVAGVSGAPVRILGWDEERQVWLARRDGEPSFVWVQGFTDAYRTARVSRGVDLIVPASIYRQWIAAGDAPSRFPAASSWQRSNRPPMPHEATGPARWSSHTAAVPNRQASGPPIHWDHQQIADNEPAPGRPHH